MWLQEARSKQQKFYEAFQRDYFAKPAGFGGAKGQARPSGANSSPRRQEKPRHRRHSSGQGSGCCGRYSSGQGDHRDSWRPLLRACAAAGNVAARSAKERNAAGVARVRSKGNCGAGRLAGRGEAADVIAYKFLVCFRH